MICFKLFENVIFTKYFLRLFLYGLCCISFLIQLQLWGIFNIVTTIIATYINKVHELQEL